jgi:hypothetical protein
MKNGFIYNLKLKDNITIIDGDNGTGKTLLANELNALKSSGQKLTGIDASNIIIINEDKDLDKIEDSKKLYIIDRADMILNDTVCDNICSCVDARFLIFARGSYNLGVSPNHFGTFERSSNCITIHYEFNESWW